jgi:hypothetical protein
VISSPKGGVSGGEEGYNNVASAMFRFATSGNFTSHLAGENAGVISRARSSFILKEESRVMVNTENMNSLSALDHRIMEKFLSLVRPPMRVHQLISRSDIGQQKYNWNLSPASSGEGSAVSAFPSDKVCEVVEKMKLMQCKQGASSTSSDHTKGIGIVQLLRGKNFLITGATGFLVKGDSFSES